MLRVSGDKLGKVWRFRFNLRYCHRLDLDFAPLMLRDCMPFDKFVAVSTRFGAGVGGVGFGGGVNPEQSGRGLQGQAVGGGGPYSDMMGWSDCVEGNWGDGWQTQEKWGIFYI
ncbi:hypothetical protein FA13DRAFT_1749951 [Coprinellus micaceus]|uniref:Uncharacterized protein n=1 Tax=Coprinellus micaceus TaxID=71717 RepID=A0A4Y7RC10_COPMI|nr:hypothetical protein FA13DRAFT_1749951 [Coprinellus micaceus]